MCRIFGCKGIYLLHHRQDAVILSQGAHHQSSLTHTLKFCLESYGTSNLEIGETIYLSLTQQILAQVIDIAHCLQALVNINNMLEFFEEPLVYLCKLVNLVDGISGMHGLGDDEHALVGRFTQGSIYIRNLQFLVLNKSVHTLTNHTKSLLDSFLEVATDSHNLAHRLHRRTEFLVNTTELGEVPTWYLTYYIVEGGFEECRGGLCHRVLQLKQAISHTQLGSYESKRITCCL